MMCLVSIRVVREVAQRVRGMLCSAMHFLRVKLVVCEFLYDRFRNEHGQHVAEIRLHAHVRHAGELACHSPGVSRRALEHCWL